MSTIQQVRDFLTSKGGSAPFAHVHAEVGGDDRKLAALLSFYSGRGEMKVGDDENKTVKLLRAKPATGKKAGRAKSSPKPKARRARRARPFKKLADKHAAKHVTTNGAALHALALENLVAASQDLRRAIGDLGDTPAIGRAVRQYDLAEQIHDAAKA